MTNKDIAKAFQLLGQLMELYGENPYKIRSYQNAYINLRKLGEPLSEMAPAEIESIKGVGKAISEKIRQLLETGKMETLERYRSKTPEGIQELLGIKGFGPKKIKVVWDKLGVESPGELLYAVNENRLLDLKGFGKKTQDDLRNKLEYYLRSRDQFHYATMDREANLLEKGIAEAFPGILMERTGALRRGANVLTTLEFQVSGMELTEGGLKKAGLKEVSPLPEGWAGRSPAGLPTRIYPSPAGKFGGDQFERTGSAEFLQAFSDAFPEVALHEYAAEAEIFGAAGIPVLPPELREKAWGLELAREDRVPELVQESDIKGVVHAHTTDSDGVSSLREMATYAKEQGYAYLTITDHSRSAFYANGLSPERLLQQCEAIDALNAEMAPFRIFKGIESDILNDGSLDYAEEVLEHLDLVIASVHSNLRMDERKATDRLVRAIENPHTRILGHMTGRLLLSRPGYPVDHLEVIDACARHGVAIELNANPWRLDMDWSWIPAALERGVYISINPDAHSKEGIHDIKYGVVSARKGGLSAGMCLNCLSAGEFADWCHRKP